MDNIGRIMAAMQGAGVDALMITSERNRFFATGFSSSAGVLVLAGGKAWFFTDFRYIEAARAKIRSAEVGLVDGEETYGKKIGEVLASAGIKALGFEEEAVRYSEYLEWSRRLSVPLEPAQKLLKDLRMAKGREELSGLVEAQRIAEKSFEEVLPLISTGMTERELAAELVYRCLRNGADDKAFDPIVVSGARTSMPHGAPTDMKIEKGFLTIDFGVVKNGWCSDTTRTLCVGRPDGEMENVYRTVLEAQLAGISAVRAGARGCDVDLAARRVIEEAGYGDFFGHGFGHGVGLEVHELPNASPSFKGEIPEGAVISAEPGIYIPGRFGVRIEDVLYVTESGCENLTSLPKELTIV